MGNHWYVRYSGTIDSSIIEVNLSIYQKRRPRIIEGDKIVFYFDRAFISSGVVVKAPPLKEEQTEAQSEFEYVFGQIQLIDTPNDLLGYAYSLPKVYKHYIRPYYHFNRSYGSLTEYEYNVITQHDYFISRTAFGRIINSLHPAHRGSFINYATEIDPTAILNEQKDYVLVFNLLKDYIKYHIILQAEMLKESNSILANELNIESDVGFLNPTSNLNQSLIINRQVERIQRAENSIIPETSLDTIAISISEIAQDELVKNNQFKDKCLPLNY